MKNKIVLSLIILTILSIGSFSFGESGIYDRFGILVEHGLHGAVPEENIDLFTGNLTLRNLDIQLPGPNGFDLQIWRIYNSKVQRDRLVGNGYGYQQEPYSPVGFGWSMHMGRVRNFNSATGPIYIEFPDGRNESAYPNINDSSSWVTRDFLKLVKADSNYSGNTTVYFPDGTVWIFAAVANIKYDGVTYEQVKVLTQIRNSYGHHIDVYYMSDGSGRIDYINDAFNRTVNFDYSNNKLTQITAPTATGSTATYSYTVDKYNGDFTKLTRFKPPEIPEVTYEYYNGLASNFELIAVNTSFGGRMEYTYAEKCFYYMSYALYTRVVTSKKINGKTWSYNYPSYQNVASGTVNITGPEYNSTCEYNAYTSSAPWQIGLIKSRSQGGSVLTENMYWEPQIISTTHWIVLSQDMGQITAPLKSKNEMTITGESKYTEEFKYNDSTLKRYGLTDRVNHYAGTTLKNYTTLHYKFQNYSPFANKYMLNYVDDEAAYNGSGTLLKETKTDFYDNGAVKTIDKLKESGNFLRWNYTYSESSPSNITVGIDLPGSAGTETHQYRYGVLSSLQKPTYTEMSRQISQYDSSILSETNMHGGTMAFTYDTLGRIRRIDMPSGFNPIVANWSTTYVSITQGSNTLVKYWDSMGRDLGYTESGDGVTLYFRRALDGEGRLVSESRGSNSQSDVFSYVLNAAGKATRVTDPNGNATNIAYSGTQKTVTDANQKQHTFQYNDLPGLVTRLAEPVGPAAVYAYDALGRLTQIDFSTRTQGYAYNGLDQLKSETHPETGTINYVYNAEGNLGSKSWGNTSISYAYNNSNQLVTANSGDETTTYSYDGNGRVSGVSGSGWSRTSIGYNTLGSVTSETQTIPGLAGGKTTSYAYDSNNNVQTITYPDGLSASYGNNGLNLPKSLTFNSKNLISQIDYGNNRQPTAMNVVGNGTVFSATYFPRGLLSTAACKLGGNSLYSASYGYDGVGNVTAINNTTPTLNASFAYDDLNRLKSASYSPSGTGRADQFNYYYDDFGNMTRVMENGVDVANTTYTGQNQVSGFGYDSRGNLTSSTYNNLSWDNENRLKQILSKANVLQGEFVYDDRGMRLKSNRFINMTINVNSPNGGESWEGNSLHDITWTATGFTGTVTIDLYKGASLLRNIGSTDAAIGIFPWTVSTALDAASDYKVRIYQGALVEDYSDNDFSIYAAPPPTLQVTYPNGGETLQAGTEETITWTSTNLSPDELLNLEYSVDNGNTWLSIGQCENEGEYSWIVQNASSSACKVRLSRVAGSALADASDGVFTILPGYQGETDFDNDGICDIVWRNYSTGQNGIWLMNADGTRKGTMTLPALTDLNWKIGGLGDFDNDGIPDIVWRHYGTGNNTIWLMNADGTIKLSQVIKNEDNVGWRIVGVGDFNGDKIPDLLWRFQSSGGAQGQNGIWIMNADMTFNHGVALPVQADLLWRVGGVGDFNNDAITDIAWRHYGTGDNVIWLMKNDVTIKQSKTISKMDNVNWRIAGAGDFNGDNIPDLIWRFSLDGNGQGQNAVWIMNRDVTFNRSVALPARADLNWYIVNGGDSPDGVATSGITMIFPNGGEVLQVGASYDVQWASFGNVGALKVECSTDNGASWRLLDSSTANDDHLTWIVGETPSTNCVFKLSETDGSPADVSDDVFVIGAASPTVTVTSPNGGENWQVGTSHDITWTVAGVSGNVTVDLYKNNVFNQNIGSATAASGKLTWAIPSGLTIAADYKIKVSQGAVEDYSNDNFSLVATLPASLTVTYPNGGETLHVGDAVNITWQSTNLGPTEVLNIEYSIDSGNTWLSVGQSPNDGVIAWSVPNNPSANCRVRVSKASGSPLSDTSDGTFTILAGYEGGADFDNDGVCDIFWRNYSTGQNSIWLMNANGTLKSTIALPVLADVNWKIGGIGDFDRDGIPDIVWRHYVSGDNSIWLMNANGTIKSTQAIKNENNVTWRIVGVGDFNGDMIPDLLWRCQSTGGSQGQNGVWVMNADMSFNHGVALPTQSDLLWRICGVSDFDGDAVTDIVWRHYGTGDNVIWLMNTNGTIKLSQTIKNENNTGWMIVGAGDFSGDQVPDLLWRFQSTGGSQGQDGVWVMNADMSFNHGVALPVQADLNWYIVNGGAFSVGGGASSNEFDDAGSYLMRSFEPTVNFGQNDIYNRETGKLRGPIVLGKSTEAMKTTGIRSNNDPGSRMALMGLVQQTSYYIYSNDGKLLSEYDATGICLRDYIYVGNRLVAEYQPATGQYYYYMGDQINSTRMVTDNGGNVVYSATHDPFGGIEKVWVNTYDPKLKFSGKEREAASELDYFGARYYDHINYRFNSVDPIINKDEALSNPQLWNLYSYCRNNPISFLDPNGKKDEKTETNSKTRPGTPDDMPKPPGCNDKWKFRPNRTYDPNEPEQRPGSWVDPEGNKWNWDPDNSGKHKNPETGKNTPHWDKIPPGRGPHDPHDRFHPDGRKLTWLEKVAVSGATILAFKIVRSVFISIFATPVAGAASMLLPI